MPALVLPFPQIDPVLIELGPIAIRWYALAYIAGLLIGWQFARRIVHQKPWSLTPEQVDDFLFYVTLGVIAGGRLGFALFYHPGYYLTHPHEILMVWQGGMSFHGGLLGVIVAIAVFARKTGTPLLEVSDLAGIVAPIGIFFGRVANFINGELWGRPTDVPWAMVFPNAGPQPRHPSQLYEAALEGIVLFAIVYALSRSAETVAAHGRIAGTFLVGYALARTSVEFVREPDAHLGVLFDLLTMGQLLSLPMFLIGVFLIATSAGRRKPSHA